MKMVLVVDGESADDLFAVGPVDIREHFCPFSWGIRPHDVVKIHFEEVHRGGKIISPRETLTGGPYSVRLHKDNYKRDGRAT